MFDLVTKNLVAGTLPNWLPYLQKFVKYDTLLPEVLGSPTLPKHGFTALKLLHAESDEDLFILRPGQTLAMQNLQEPKMKEAYCYLKALKNIMGLDISSYGLKKVLLLEDFSHLAEAAKNASHLLYLALTHPHLHSIFRREFAVKRNGISMRVEINFDDWERSPTGQKIPLRYYY